MKQILLLLLILAGCGTTDTTQTINETTQEVQEIVPLNDTIDETVTETTDEMAQEESTNQTNETEIPTTDATEPETTPIEQPQYFVLTHAQQQIQQPMIEASIKNSPCYQLGWSGMNDYTDRWPLTVTKQVRLQYKENDYWRGWIDYALLFSREAIAKQTLALTVNNTVVECPKAANYTIDWDYTITKHTER